MILWALFTQSDEEYDEELEGKVNDALEQKKLDDLFKEKMLEEKRLREAEYTRIYERLLAGEKVEIKPRHSKGVRVEGHTYFGVNFDVGDEDEDTISAARAALREHNKIKVSNQYLGV